MSALEYKTSEAVLISSRVTLALPALVPLLSLIVGSSCYGDVEDDKLKLKTQGSLKIKQIC